MGAQGSRQFPFAEALAPVREAAVHSRGVGRHSRSGEALGGGLALADFPATYPTAESKRNQFDLCLKKPMPAKVLNSAKYGVG